MKLNQIINKAVFVHLLALQPQIKYSPSDYHIHRTLFQKLCLFTGHINLNAIVYFGLFLGVRWFAYRRGVKLE